jgi:acyl-CoA synthetase (NDP forming)
MSVATILDRDMAGTRGAAARDLTALFDPGSVAIVGATSDPNKWGNWIAGHALRGADRRSVYLVNRRGEEILGQPSYRTLSELPEPPELAVVAVPASSFEATVDEALAIGTRAIVGISGGLGESGPEGLARQEALVRRVRAAGAVLLGPNCLGVLDAATGLDLTTDDMPIGSVGLISQSGNLALELGLLLERVGMGWSRFASLGNQADVTLADLVRSYAEHDLTKAIAIYCEDFADGRGFIEAVTDAALLGKPTVLITVGSSHASQRASRSHTGALTSDSAVVDAACAAAGVVRVATPAQMVTALQALSQPKRPRGRRVAILADGGGHGAIAADLVDALGLQVSAFSGELAERVRSELRPTASVGNPIDMAGSGEQDITSFARVIRVLVDSDEIDAVLVTGYFGGYGGYSHALREGELATAHAIGTIVEAADCPLIVHTMHEDRAAPRILRAAGVPVYDHVDDAAAALELLTRAGVPHPLQPVGPAAEPVRDSEYWTARSLLASYGVPFVPGGPAASGDEAVKVAEQVGYPVVVKALGLDHKSDAGGVVLGLTGPAELAAAVADLQTRLAPRLMTVEQMAELSTGVELIAGARWDPRFGPVVLVGLGGVYTEVLRDITLALAPVDDEQARELLLGLRGAPMLLGARGRPPVDVDGAAAAIAALSRAAAAHPEVEEIEVNPLFVSPETAVGLDARLVLRAPHRP